MTHDNTTTDGAPYAGLTPDTLLDAIESTGLAPDGRLQALNSYENRVYQFGVEDEKPLIAKFYRPDRWSDAQILEEHDFVQELAERELPVVAPLLLANGTTLHTHGGYRIAVYPRCGGRAPELEQPDTLEWMGRFLGRIHAVGALKPFVERPALDIDTFGYEPRDYLLDHGFVPAELEEAWISVVDHALESAERCFDRAGEVATLRLHGDCHGGNVLWIERRGDDDTGNADTQGGPHFVDFDDARTGPAIQDLWMLLSGDRETMKIQFNHVLRGYEDFAEFDDRERHLVEPLRTLRLIHYSGWIGRRWSDPAFPAAFPWFDTPRYWQDRILELREQISLMDEAPL
jgi:Ser/Thr protein kinase RdoA (MazF antagonist)